MHSIFKFKFEILKQISSFGDKIKVTDIKSSCRYLDFHGIQQTTCEKYPKMIKEEFETLQHISVPDISMLSGSRRSVFNFLSKYL